MFEKFKNIRAALHLIAIVASSVVAALTAGGLGGDPFTGAAIGASLNAMTAAAVY